MIGGFFSGLLYMLGLPDYIYLTAGGLRKSKPQSTLIPLTRVSTVCVVPLFPMFFIPQLARAPGSTHFQTPLVPLVPWCGILVNTYLLFQVRSCCFLFGDLLDGCISQFIPFSWMLYRSSGW